PAVGAAVHPGPAALVVDPAKLAGETVDSGRPADRHERLDTAPRIGSRAPLGPAGPGHRPAEPGRRASDPGPRSSQPARIIGCVIRARWRRLSTMLPRSGEGSGSWR